MLGVNVTIHDETSIGDGCVIEDGAVVGKRPRLSRHSTTPRSGQRGAAIAAGVSIGTHSVIFAGATIEADVVIGDQCFIRERTRLGPSCVIGRGSVVEPDVTIGARCRIQTNVYLTRATLLEEDVFVGPRRAHDQRRHDGPPRRELRAARGDTTARVSRWRRRGVAPRYRGRRGGVRRRGRGRHTRRPAPRPRHGRPSTPRAGNRRRGPARALALDGERPMITQMPANRSPALDPVTA